MGETVSKKSLNLAEELKNNLKRLSPEIFTEDMIEGKDGKKEIREKIDFDKLKTILGEEIAAGNEQYSFSWAGKKDAIKAIQKQSNGTLIPDKEESVDFDNSDNLFIEGDNLEVLKLLQKSYHNKVKMIYIDPPYNTGGDFVYKDDYKDSITNYLKKTGQLDENGVKLTTNSESNGRFHSDWLNMMYPRLFLARNLLKEDGIFFISIDDNEVHNLRKICDEIFGENNFVGEIIRKTKSMTADKSTGFNMQHESLIIYSKDISNVSLIGEKKDFDDYSNPDDDPRGNWTSADPSAKSGGESTYFEIKNPLTGRSDYPPEGRYWAFSEKTLKKYIENGRIKFRKEYSTGQRGFTFKRYKDELNDLNNPVNSLFGIENSFMNQHGTKELQNIFNKDIFDNPKPANFLKKIIKYSTFENEIVLDFFAGSATTAQAVLEQNQKDKKNRKFIMVQLPEPTEKNTAAFQEGFENIADIGKERIRRVINGYGDHDPINAGFKVFKLDKSNYKIWEEIESSEATVEEIKTQLNLFEDSLVEDYRGIDVLYEVIIKEGYSLNAKTEKKDLEQNTVYKVIENEDYFYVCLDKKVEFEILDELDYKENETVFVCLDTALDDNNKINLSLRLNLKTI